ncbi:RdgB/HAM1 family non-canonical purine NTP pyrophosphatase [Balneola sp. MJW-20]|uniref:RdgB/HAM1 family non-canonical purine NTP pyrophosphatase n=1 Tax=Gracilimonas aurantiaca TaxID=3234185 RepID=UPI003466BD25
MKRLVLASRNKHKIEELRDLLRPLGIDLLSALDFPELEEVVEDKDTLEGNALKKARYVSAMTGLPAVSDDTGLEVDALAGAPGVYSARYAGEDATYGDNVRKLLSEMDGKSNRRARFRTAVALVHDSLEEVFEGICPGQIIREEKGDKGFGYDPVFMPEGYERTFAELDSEVKNRISHRGRAIQKLIEYLK